MDLENLDVHSMMSESVGEMDQPETRRMGWPGARDSQPGFKSENIPLPLSIMGMLGAAESWLSSPAAAALVMESRRVIEIRSRVRTLLASVTRY